VDRLLCCWQRMGGKEVADCHGDGDGGCQELILTEFLELETGNEYSSDTLRHSLLSYLCAHYSKPSSIPLSSTKKGEDDGVL
jgi:hypothetical protein